MILKKLAFNLLWWVRQQNLLHHWAECSKNDGCDDDQKESGTLYHFFVFELIWDVCNKSKRYCSSNEGRIRDEKKLPERQLFIFIFGAAREHIVAEDDGHKSSDYYNEELGQYEWPASFPLEVEGDRKAHNHEHYGFSSESKGLESHTSHVLALGGQVVPSVVSHDEGCRQQTHYTWQFWKFAQLIAEHTEANENEALSDRRLSDEPHPFGDVACREPENQADQNAEEHEPAKVFKNFQRCGFKWEGSLCKSKLVHGLIEDDCNSVVSQTLPQNDGKKLWLILIFDDGDCCNNVTGAEDRAKKHAIRSAHFPIYSIVFIVLWNPLRKCKHFEK